MQNYWNETEAAQISSDLDMRVYTSRLLGKDMNLVMHGGGNTSVKSQVNGEDILYVKGSGWDLETIEPAGFAPVKLDALLKM
ncbi:class II aldolase/adducin family protein, partial [Hydrogenovibrio marinus]